MENIFLIKLLLSFIVGGSYIASTIWVSEKYGSRIGGLLIGLPSTLLVSLLFIAWTQNSQAAVSALPVVPATIAANSLFCVAFIYSYKYGKATAFLVGSLLWFALSFPLAFFSLKSILISFFLIVPKVGIIFGTILAYVMSLLFAIIVNNTLLKKEKECHS